MFEHAGMNDIVVAGGMESMSNCPHYFPGGTRSPGLRLGHAQVTDGLLHDGLWDAHADVHMGECAERCVDCVSVCVFLHVLACVHACMGVRSALDLQC